MGLPLPPSSGSEGTRHWKLSNQRTFTLAHDLLSEAQNVLSEGEEEIAAVVLSLEKDLDRILSSEII